MTLENFSGSDEAPCNDKDKENDHDEEKKNGQEKSEGKVSSKNKDREKGGRIRRRLQKSFLSSKKMLVVSFLGAAVFCFGVLLTHLIHIHNQNQNQVSHPSCSRSNFKNLTSQQIDGKNHSSSTSSSLHKQIPVDPCEDFYEFACASLAGSNNPTAIEHTFILTVQLILGHGYAENGAEEKAQNFYRSCVNAAADPESMLMNEELPGMLEKLDKIPHGNFQEKLELIQFDYGFSPFFTWSASQDDDVEDENKDEDGGSGSGGGNLDSNVIQINLGLNDPKDQENVMGLLESSDRIKTVMAEILGHRINFTGKSNDSDFRQLVNLEREIRESLTPPLVDQSASASESNSSMNLNMNLTQLQNLAGFINWKQFFSSGIEKLNLNLTITDNAKVLVSCSQCLSKLSKKLGDLASSTAASQKLLDQFLIWHVGKKILGDILSVMDSPASATTICSTLTTKYYKMAVASMHRRYFLKQNPDLETHSIKTARRMAENIRDELILSLKESEWLDENSRDGAIEKARKIQVQIGYPEVVKSSTSLEKLYEDVPEMYESDFIGNMMSLLKLPSPENWRRRMFRINVNEDEDFDIDVDMDVVAWSKVLENNAYTFIFLNSIVIPVRNLLPPHFAPKSSESYNGESYNYGRLGFTIGHELFHGFTHSGSNWDLKGYVLSRIQNQNQTQSLWQTEETTKEMENRSSCLIHQYSKFSYPDGKPLNGTQLIEENFADNGGLDLATRAFFGLLNRKKINSNIKSSGGKDQKKKKLDPVNDKQMFFISFAQRWCTDKLPEFSTDSHSPAKFRVLGALQNSKAFSEAFNCSLKSTMNAQDKCSIF